MKVKGFLNKMCSCTTVKESAKERSQYVHLGGSRATAGGIMEGRRTEIVSLLLTISPIQDFDEQDVVDVVPIAHSMLKPL